MQYFLYALLLVVFQAGIAVSNGDTEAKRFLRDCPALLRCGEINISSPFSLDSRPSYCSPSGMQLSCKKNTLLRLSLPNIGQFEVTNIIYDLSLIKLKFVEPSWNSCPLQKLASINLTDSPYFLEGPRFAFLNCSTNITLSNATEIVGPLSCLSNEHHFVYVTPAAASIVSVPSVCDVIPTAGQIPYLFLYDSLEQWVQNVTQMREIDLYWEYYKMLYNCQVCNERGKPCIYSQSKNKFYCLHQGPRVDLIVGLVIGVLVIFVVVAGILFYKLQKFDKEKEAVRKVEKFLETYGSTAPTRYTYTEVIKIAKRFKLKLGQGGFGSVYKGVLPNGIPVAVKILEKFIGEGEEFINEVSTIGRIHHFNIVHLLGFCAEGSRRALIYEFMPNESLAKHIFSREVNGQKPLSMEILQDITIGIARGIEYLHQGCNQRILHFDIKPHNILLDYNFKPKIADFGLAKLCSKEQSIVTMTAVRGTMGYIAPELYSRNFGTVSYKSDVYSFGMLLLEMTGRRKNLDPNIENQSQIYFPEWVYDQIIHNDQDFKMVFKMNDKEEIIMKKLVIVALWCIQWSPTDRPSMTKVLKMLIDSSDNLQIPPKPFVSSLDLI